MKKTPISDRLLADSELRYSYEGSKTLMHVFDSFDDKALIRELFGYRLIIFYGSILALCYCEILILIFNA